MSKRKRRRKRSAQSSAALRRNGINAFRQGDYDRAIDAWERVGKQTPAQLPKTALAEAYFRRGLRKLYTKAPNPEAGLADLQRALDLMPNDPCYAYHLGLAAHRQGDLDRAIRSYYVTRREENAFAGRAAYPLALALLQRGDDPTTQTVWSALSTEEQAMLNQANAFRRRPYTLSADAPPLWRGLAALDEGNQEKASRLLDRALAESTSAFEKGTARYYLGVLAAQNENWEEAGQQWSAAHAAGSASTWLKANLGELYHRLAENRLQNEDIERALEAAVEARRHKPGDKRLDELFSQGYQRQAYQAVSAGDWEKALERWGKANEVGGGSFRLAYNLALAYEQAEDFGAAGETWREALRRRPRRTDHPDAVSDEQVARLWRRAAEAYHKAGEYEEAANVYRQALKWNPEDLETRMALAEGLLNDGRLVAAQNELNRILERDPDNIPALLRMGEVVAESDQWWQRAAAARYWKRVLELDPDHANARQSLADFYQNQAENLVSWGNYKAAIEEYERALRYQPKSGRILAGLGSCYLRMSDEDAAQPLIEQALRNEPGNLDIYNEIIHAWLDRGDADRAWQVMTQAEAANETIPFTFYIVQAAYCIESDDDDLAHPWLERAVDKAPPSEPILAIIGEMAMTLGALTIAREYLGRAVKAGQGSGQAYMMLGVLSVITDNDFKTADRYWYEAERIARRERDPDLRERIELARVLFSAPPGLLDLLGGGLPYPGGIGLDDFLFPDLDKR
jgi:tetratricopeptide (TPR) repeat protein